MHVRYLRGVDDGRTISEKKSIESRGCYWRRRQNFSFAFFIWRYWTPTPSFLLLHLHLLVRLFLSHPNIQRQRKFDTKCSPFSLLVSLLVSSWSRRPLFSSFLFNRWLTAALVIVSVRPLSLFSPCELGSRPFVSKQTLWRHQQVYTAKQE